jgi:hypothetical protein
MHSQALNLSIGYEGVAEMIAVDSTLPLQNQLAKFRQVEFEIQKEVAETEAPWCPHQKLYNESFTLNVYGKSYALNQAQCQAWLTHSTQAPASSSLIMKDQ